MTLPYVEGKQKFYKIVFPLNTLYMKYYRTEKINRHTNRYYNIQLSQYMLSCISDIIWNDSKKGVSLIFFYDSVWLLDFKMENKVKDEDLEVDILWFFR